METVAHAGYNIKLNPSVYRENLCKKVCIDPNCFDIYNEVAKKFIKPGDIVADVGSWIGFTCLNWVDKGAAQVYSYEPVKKFYQRIVDINCDKIKTHNFALSDTSGKRKMFISSHEVGSTLDLKLKKHFQKLFKNNETEIVTTKKLDELGYDFTFNFMKINAEGSEEYIIQGGANYFKKHTPDYLFIECHLNYQECNKLLAKLYKHRYAVNKISTPKGDQIRYDLNGVKSNTNHYVYTNKIITN